MRHSLTVRSRTGMSDIAGTGFTAVDRIYAGGTEPPEEALGGSCGNVLVSLAMLGHSVAPILSLGDDAAGDFLVAQLSAAGARTEFVFRSRGHASPVIAQLLDAGSGRHWFSFSCPETGQPFPRYAPLDADHVWAARPVLASTRVFYLDRLSESIIEAMEMAARSGAVVYFEPADTGSPYFARALAAAHIVKFSQDLLGDCIRTADVASGGVLIRTHGADGLTVEHDGNAIRLPACPVPRVFDTCGAGDMVTVGLIDHLLRQPCGDPGRIEDLLDGVRAGQRLAAANCMFPGARGIFKHLGTGAARAVLDGRGVSPRPGPDDPTS